ncbi:ABC transporter permease [Luteibacter aegosomatissinici]|nr:ABC transporter permease [Luteibacter aegosomatissinici]UPG96732.1 ABC transporter permease [Luteibacter aegosomatissinici]
MAVRSLRRNPVLTALMVVAIALGIGACMTTLTALHVLDGDPLPGRSGSIYMPRIEPRASDASNEVLRPDQLTWTDGMALLHAARATHQALMVGGEATIRPGDPGVDPFIMPARFTSADFFPMFGAPFQFGQGWSAADDEGRAHVAVISDALNARLFGGANSVGRSIQVNDTSLRIIGVLAPWRPVPHFYDLNTGAYASPEDIYLPLTTARATQLPRAGGIQCWSTGSTEEALMESAPCAWLQFWVQLDSADAVKAYLAYLNDYVHVQHASGRFELLKPAELTSVKGLLDEKQVVPGDVRLQFWLASAFFVVCLVNTVGLMLAKFLRRAGELGVRRALGASRRHIFAQLLVEAAIVGLAGGVVGLGLAWAGLGLVRLNPNRSAQLAHMDISMLLTTFVLSVVAASLAGLFPAWRACQVPPGLHLKSQ